MLFFSFPFSKTSFASRLPSECLTFWIQNRLTFCEALSGSKLFAKGYQQTTQIVTSRYAYISLRLYHFKYTMHIKFSNCFVWVSPSTSDDVIKIQAPII